MHDLTWEGRHNFIPGVCNKSWPSFPFSPSFPSYLIFHKFSPTPAFLRNNINKLLYYCIRMTQYKFQDAIVYSFGAGCRGKKRKKWERDIVKEKNVLYKLGKRPLHLRGGGGGEWSKWIIIPLWWGSSISFCFLKWMKFFCDWTFYISIVLIYVYDVDNHEQNWTKHVLGTIFANICCKLIISQMSNTRCELFRLVHYRGKQCLIHANAISDPILLLNGVSCKNLLLLMARTK